MGDKTDEEERASLLKARRACKFISVVMKIALGGLCVWWVYTIALMCNALFNQSDLNNAASVSLLGLAIYLVHSLVVLCICVVLVRIFSDSAKGESPFSLVQVKRLRIISALLVAYSLIELAYSFNASYMNVDGSALGYNTSVVTLDVAPIIAAAAIFAFSFVFKYGVLLQEFSDEAI